ncbi:acyl-phosphate glycerol 3-phosphate acyltransferase [Halochromatium glycolicum]|jgi:glycerol-3-phosphate acyltransferase PlsY|uniref:Glycerol-3-phosphate acyltransferase n=2 Tax=Halochromatium glycolicum TaxID=85075 RepID=A0AAJ0X9J0_9GAMM|nr:glycerol-3-phosphate 1-O-acyltransferase PlsY [Halochromatium glycolicum]MBK1704120.1 acyl-phosphate glycerol 3-phosphate acyltransferase [Halochromatium glycolicum]
MNTLLLFDLTLVAAAYLLGSISSAIIVCRLMRLPDPRTQGSGNPGATNVLRIGGPKARKAAAITLFGDSLKGFLPMFAAHLLGATGIVDASAWLLAGVGLAAFLGHLYPVFFGFKGGKGVATALGVQFGLLLPLGAAVAAIWLFVAKVLKVSSASALISMALAPLLVWLLWPLHAEQGTAVLVGMQTLMTLILFWRHRSNIRNLLAGTEGRIGDDRGPDEPSPGTTS